MLSRLPYSAWNTPGSSGPKCLRYLLLLAVSDSEPRLRPWKPPRKAISCRRLVWWRASLIAASTASVPELVRNVCQALSRAVVARRAVAPAGGGPLERRACSSSFSHSSPYVG